MVIFVLSFMATKLLFICFILKDNKPHFPHPHLNKNNLSANLMLWSFLTRLCCIGFCAQLSGKGNDSYCNKYPLSFSGLFQKFFFSFTSQYNLSWLVEGRGSFRDSVFSRTYVLCLRYCPEGHASLMWKACQGKRKHVEKVHLLLAAVAWKW